MRELVADSHHGFRNQVIAAVEHLSEEQKAEFLAEYPEWETVERVGDSDDLDPDYDSWVSEWIEDNTHMFWEEGDLWERKITQPRDVQIRVLEQIKAHGFRQFDMEYWFSTVEVEETTRTDFVFVEEENEYEWVEIPGLTLNTETWALQDACHIDIDNCGTTACLAGFTMLVACELGDDEELFPGQWERNVAQYLGVHTRMFHVNEWPEEMRVERNNLDVETSELFDEEELTGDADIDSKLVTKRDSEYRDYTMIVGFLEDLIAGLVDGNGYYINGGLQHP